ncbi:MAG: hypothetical protein RIQ74_1047, partial [Pseudomonadota bacterium]
MKNYLKTQQNEFGQNVGFSLKHNLSIQPISGTLKGQYINLIDVAEGLSEQAASLIWDCVVTEPSEECWTYLPYSAPQSQIALKNNLQNLFGFKDSTHFLIEVDGEVQGWIALLNPRLGHAAIEIGNVYFSHKMKKSKAATEAIFLLLKQCFKYGFRRVEWKCDDANAPSKAAALRFG